MSFGFTASFCINQANALPWKSVNELAANVRRIGKKLRILNEFENGLNELRVLIITLFTCYKSPPLSVWIQNNTFQRVNDLIFGKIQTIAYPFINNKKSQKSLKTSIENYHNFARILSDYCRENNTPPLIILSRNQRKAIYNLHWAISNAKNTKKSSKLDQEHLFFTKPTQQSSFNEDDLQKYIHSDRLQRAEHVLRNRTDRILLILDGCYDMHNIHAMLRNAEIFGVQNVWIVRPIEYRNIDICNRISKSSQNWLTIKFFNSSNECIKALKQSEKHKHRKIYVMDVGKDAAELSAKEIIKSNLSSLLKREYYAIVLGKESSGPSDDFLKICDRKIFLSQFGFTESFNVSVACSIMLNNLFLMYPNMRGDIDENDRNILRKEWYKMLINDKQIQKQLTEYLDSNGEISQTDDIRIADHNAAFHATAKHKINHALRDKLQSERIDNLR